MIRAIIFDLDGTLLDSENLAIHCWLSAAGQTGVCLPREVILRTVGLRPLESRAIYQTVMTPDQYEQTYALRTAMIAEHIERHGPPLKPGAAEILDYLAYRGYKIGLATSTMRPKAESHLQRAGLWRYFAASACGDDVVNGKPAPDIYLTAAQRLGIAPDRAAAVEDSPIGILSAFRAGLSCIMIPDTIEPDAETRAMCSAVADGLSDLREIY